MQPLVDNLGLVIIKDEHGVIEVQQRRTSSPRQLMMLQARRCHGQMPHLHPTRGNISIVFEVVEGEGMTFEGKDSRGIYRQRYVIKFWPTDATGPQRAPPSQEHARRA